MKKYIIPFILAILIISLSIKWSINGTFEKFGAKLNKIKAEFSGDMKQTGNDIKQKIMTTKEKVIRKKEETKEEPQIITNFYQLDNYVEQNITVEGKAVLYYISSCTEEALEDNDGYQIWISKPSDFHMIQGEIYEITGIYKQYYSCNILEPTQPIKRK